MIVNANLVIVSVDMSENKTYILSKINNDKEFDFPVVTVTDENKNVLEEVFINKILGIIDCHELELFPQIITHHDDTISDEENTMNMVVGFLVTYKENTKHNEYRWVEFDYSKNAEPNNTIYRTIQRLK